MDRLRKRGVLGYNYALLAIALLLGNTECATGVWRTCGGKIPYSAFRAPDGFVPAWNGGYSRIGRADPPYHNGGVCKAHFAVGSDEVAATAFAYLQKVNPVHEGWEYKWTSITDFIAQRTIYRPVKYSDNSVWLSCYIRGASVKTCANGYIDIDILGLCKDDQSGKAWATYCNYAFPLTKSTIMVLTVNPVVQVSLQIAAVDIIAHDRTTVSTLRAQFKHHRDNRQSTHVFETNYTKTTTSHFTTGLESWKATRKYAVEGEMMQHELRQWLSEKEIEVDGHISTCCLLDRVSSSKYQRDFVSVPGHETAVTIPVYRDEFDIAYTGKETARDSVGHVVFETTVHGKWIGVVTHPGEPTVIHKPL